MALHKDKNIYITGFMGTGKTAVGRLLARKLQRRFVDTDAEIEQQAHTTIQNIFAHEGEQAFRQKENTVIAELQNNTNLVVSLGGGAVLNINNQAVFNKGLWIFLDTPFEIIEERVKRSAHRPLALQNSEELKKLYEQRIQEYKKAAVHISCGPLDVEDICQLVLNRVLFDENT